MSSGFSHLVRACLFYPPQYGTSPRLVYAPISYKLDRWRSALLCVSSSDYYSGIVVRAGGSVLLFLACTRVCCYYRCAIEAGSCNGLRIYRPRSVDGSTPLAACLLLLRMAYFETRPKPAAHRVTAPFARGESRRLPSCTARSTG